MKVYNKDKTEVLTDYDLEKGYLMDDTITRHIPAVESIEEVCHYETIKEYPNGGKDVKKVIDIEGREAIPAHDETKQIQVYILYTESELQKIANDKRYADLKTELAKVKEDIEQVEFGLVRDDYEAKKARACEIINELRVLEGKEARALSANIL